MKPCRALMGCAPIMQAPRPTTKRGTLLPLCVQCRARWVSKAQNLTCSIACADAYRLREAIQEGKRRAEQQRRDAWNAYELEMAK